mmetsp:Transcript_19506/g.54268  ORF Transcript_19506/g.54268 Transcript_19506/m.54268 type:complete len:93 (-) Transcript_19506:188-466(-)
MVSAERMDSMRRIASCTSGLSPFWCPFPWDLFLFFRVLGLLLRGIQAGLLVHQATPKHVGPGLQHNEGRRSAILDPAQRAGNELLQGSSPAG